MLVLRVQINDQPPLAAGAEDLGVLNAIVGAGGRLGRLSQLGRAGDAPHIHLSLGGLTARDGNQRNEHLHWASHHDLRVGDRVVIDILESDVADPVESGRAAEQRASGEREYFEHAKKVYLELRSTYEPDPA